MADAVSFVRTEEQTMLADTLRSLLDDATDADRTRELSLTSNALDTAVWKSLADMGVVGLTLPSSVGGADAGFEDLAVVFEELGRIVAAVPLLSTVMAATVIDLAGTDEQRARLLPGIAAGTTIATLAAFEGAHDTAPGPGAATAVTVGEWWRLEGTKTYVTDLPNADVAVVAASVEGELGLFVVPLDVDGVSIETLPALDATRPLGHLTLSVELPMDARLNGGNATDALDRGLDVGVCALAQEQVGGAQRCLEMSVEYAKTRFQFGRAIGSFQAIKHACADMLIAVEHAKSAAWYAATTLEDPVERKVSVPLARSVCSDAYLKVAGDTIQVFGGIGFTWEHEAHLYFKRAKASTLLLGSVEAHRDRLGDAIGV